MFCAISGEIPKEPVIAKSTGILFEKNLIEKLLKDKKSCPITNTPLSEDDLLPIQVSTITPPRASAAPSVPGLLHALQQEWDETVLESFNLRQQLDLTRKELAHSLYQHDAACRVIARLTRERDEAYQMIRQLQANGPAKSLPSNGADDAMEVAPAPIASNVDYEKPLSESVIEELNTVCKGLSSTRKGRKAPETLLPKEEMAQISELTSYKPNKSDSKGQLTSLALKSKFQFNDNIYDDVILVGSSDNSILLNELKTGRVCCKLTGHKAAINNALFSSNSSMFYSASDDQTVRFWAPNSTGGYSEEGKIDVFGASVKGLTLQASGNYLISVTENNQWQFLNIPTKTCVKIVTDKESNYSYSACSLHPDGLILGTGTNTGALKIWDIRDQKNVANLTNHTATINSIAFSENGYLAATGSDDGSVKIWDLRKLTSTKSFELGGPVNAVSFDYSGVYLGIGGGGSKGNQVQVKVVKDWSTSITFDSHESTVTGFAWGENATKLVTSSLDSTVRVYGKNL